MERKLRHAHAELMSAQAEVSSLSRSASASRAERAQFRLAAAQHAWNELTSLSTAA
ncbi:hypothetical protein I6E29_04595 [Arcanobacterium haemolyticum]|nr:hypothetical protein [Arcanobacterium haemolyticum]